MKILLTAILLIFISTLLLAKDIASLRVTPNPIKTNKDTKLNLSATVIYNDGSENQGDGVFSWVSRDEDILNIEQNGTATALKEGVTVVHASYKGVISEAIQAFVYVEINGHRLPPEPDKTLNDSTLLGIDINNNDVRDDVERWIYFKYQNKHPVHIDIAMQAGRAWQKVLEDPRKAKEIHDYVNAPGDCQFYYMNDAKYFNEPILVNKRIITRNFINKILFNTEERERAFLEYDKLLSGSSYTLPKSKVRKSLCDFNTSKYEE